MTAECNAYHPDPVRTGSARVDDVPCVLCGRTETAKYQGQAFSTMPRSIRRHAFPREQLIHRSSR